MTLVEQPNTPEPDQPTAPYAQQPSPYGQPPTPYGQQPNPYGQPSTPYAQPGYTAVPPAHPSANTALVLGLVGLIGYFLCGVTIFLSPFAWSAGSKAIREIDAEPGRYSGRDTANTGRILGIIGTVILGLSVLALLVVIVFFAAAIPMRELSTNV